MRFVAGPREPLKYHEINRVLARVRAYGTINCSNQVVLADSYREVHEAT
jgi:hypothetical protein